MPLKIALVGMPAIGKTTLGRKLARNFALDFVDLDQTIEASIGCSIREYFERMGEEAFRDVESRVLAEQLARPGVHVISTGGGIILRPENRALLRQHCHVVYLTARLETLMRRLRGDRTRPLLQVADPMARLRQLHEARHALYQDAADFEVQVDSGTRSALLAMERQLEKRGLHRPQEYVEEYGPHEYGPQDPAHSGHGDLPARDGGGCASASRDAPLR